MKNFNPLTYTVARRAIGFAFAFFFFASQNFATAPPVNDDCGSAISLGSVPLSGGGSTLDATASTDPACFPPTNDVWFTFTTDAMSTDYLLSVTGFGPTPVHAPVAVVYSGSCGSLSQVACGVGSAGCRKLSLPINGLSPSTTYFLRIDNFTECGAPDWGDFTLTIESTKSILNFSANDVTGANGDQVTVDVTVDNFDVVAGFQFSMGWDPTVIDFNSTNNYNLSDLSSASFGTQNAAGGELTIAWFDQSINGVTLPNGQVIFSLVFDVIGNGGDVSAVNFSNNPTPKEAFTGNLSLLDCMATAGSVTVTGGSGFRIFGNVSTEDGTPVPGTQMTLSGSASGMESNDVVGDYDFEELTVGGDYVISPSRDINPAECVSVQDMLALSKHILGVEIFTSPYKMIAADVNQSGSLTTLDLVEMRKLILGITTEFPNSASWRFVRADYVFSNPSNPFSDLFPEVGEVTNLSADEQINFIGMKVGDVTGCTVSGTPFFNVKAPDETAQSGDAIVLDITVEDFVGVAGAQFSINWDPTIIEFTGVQNFNLPDLSAANFGTSQTANGKLSLAWTEFTTLGVTMPNSTSIFQIAFNVIGSLGDVSPVSFTSDPTYVEAIDGLGDVFSIGTMNGSVSVVNPPNEMSLRAGQVSGCPGSQVTLPVTVADFAEIIGFQFSMEWDESVVDFSSVGNVHPDLLPGISFFTGLTASGNFAVSWFDLAAAGVSLPDDAVIFEMTFNMVGSAPSISSLDFTNSPTIIEFTDAAGLVSVLPASGLINVGGQAPTALCLTGLVLPLGSSESAFIWPTDVDDGSFDDCGIVNYSLSQSLFTCADLGTNSVTLTVEDAEGLTATCSLDVTVTGQTFSLSSLTSTDETCAGANDGTISMVAEGVCLPGPIEYRLNFGTPSSSGNFTGLAPGQYHVMATSGGFTIAELVDIGSGPAPMTYYLDSDGDGFGDPVSSISDCTQPPDYVTNSDDCDDSDTNVNPAAPEICDGIDNNCDGQTDEGILTTFYLDNDGDGYGQTGTSVIACSPPPNHVPDPDDCDDSDANVNPAAAELCDGIDNNCDGVVDEGCPCAVTAISLVEALGCQSQNTADPSDDTFIADVTVAFEYPPASGTLELSGDASAWVDVANLDGPTSHTFTGLTLSADGMAVSLSANFSDIPSCTFLENNAGTAPVPCSQLCDLIIVEVIIEHESCPNTSDANLQIVATTTLPGQLGYSVDGGATFNLTGYFDELTPGTYDLWVQVFGDPTCFVTDVAVVNPAPLSNLLTWFKDMDGDGFSDGVTLTQCDQPFGFFPAEELTATSGDCDDHDPDEFPGQMWFEDMDGDGFGTGVSQIACERPVGYQSENQLIVTSGDCDDTEASIYPGAPELCNGIDDDCDGEVDEGAGGGLTHVGNVFLPNQAAVEAFSDCFSVIDGNLTITNSVVTDLSPLINLVEVTGDVKIEGTSVTDLLGLDNLSTVGGLFFMKFNASLTTLAGLENLSLVGSDLKIFYNGILSDCCAIHPLLATGGVGGGITIMRNDTGCDSASEINLACGTSSFMAPNGGRVPPTFTASETLSIDFFPNPASTDFSVRISGEFAEGEMTVFNSSGQKVLKKTLRENEALIEMDITDWLPGFYFIKVNVGGEVFTERLVKR